MLKRSLALFDRSGNIPFSTLQEVTHALQIQIRQHLKPAWGVHADITPYKKIRDVPLTSWLVVILPRLDEPGVQGRHRTNKDNQPMAEIAYSNIWTVFTSHEILEMLTDPWGNELVTAPHLHRPEKQVQYLLEISDPCQNPAYSYQIGGISVCDFYTPHYFDLQKQEGISFNGSLTQPLQIRKGGYLSWKDPATQQWQREDRFHDEPMLQALEGVRKLRGSLRSRIDRIVVNPYEFREEEYIHLNPVNA